jgi:hypothetical protein
MKLVLTVFISAALFAVSAQEKGPDSPGKFTELTGCLSKSSTNFMIAAKTGERLEVIALPGELEPHINHEVKVAGEIVKKDNKDALSLSKIEMVAPTCASPKG